ncbi:MAG TPA: putative lipid II flippase FtsW [Thermoanaerobaculia bacterium]|jgi:cell division protein FtsW|nr:putative lipid II flippase FtsW [Thermoanaerobaculia bacterium]
MAKKLAFDKVLFTVVLVLLAGGLVMVYSASMASGAAAPTAGGLHPFVKQLIAAAIGLAAMGLTMHLDYRQLRKPLYLYGVVGSIVFLLVAVLFAPPLNNSRRWIFLSGLSVQPSELAKIAVVLFLAYQIDRKLDRVNQPAVLVPCVSMVALTVVLVLLEPDLGTAGLLVLIAGLLLFLAGLSWRYVLIATGVALPALWFLILAVPYRRARFFSFLDPEQDPLGSGFQVLQSMIAVGSGGPWGLGLGGSVQKLHFLPLAESDFIYSILAEELGLIGAIGVVVLFVVFFLRGLRAGNRAPENFGKFMAWGLTSLIVLQALLNISETVALVPTTGTTLPLISYGGSSLVTTLAACGLILNVSQHG